MKKTAIIILLISVIAKAQGNIGIEAGLSKAGFATMTTHQETGVLKPFVALFSDVQISNYLYVSPQIGFVKRGGDLSLLPSPVTSPVVLTPKATKYEYDLSYLDFSILLKSRYTTEDGPLTVSAFAGPSISYLLGGKVKEYYAVGGSLGPKDVEGITTVALGLVYGAGFSFQVPGGEIDFRAVFYTQFNSSVEANSGLTLKNFTQGLGISYRADL
ncbi:MAG: PorT family protein [Bacteroidetes bacterium]|nr:PorT family protein [Bacteroidota bacterium]